MSDLLEIQTLGGLALVCGDQPVTALRSRKAKALLVYLAWTGGPVPRDVLAGLLWPESPDALRNLRVTLTRLRAVLAPYIQARRASVSLQPDSPHWLDARELADQLAHRLPEGRTLPPSEVARLEHAARGYRGEFLAGFFVRESPAFEDWARHVRERLQRGVVEALRRLVIHHLETGAHQDGIAVAMRLLALDPLHEETHRHLMYLLTLAGQRAEALRQYETCRELLADELGVEPAEETHQLADAIRAREIVTPRQPPRVQHNLPAQLTPFVGRQDELRQLDNLLARSRLVTLTGPGGIGKTRLALEFAAMQTSHFADGVFFVSLASRDAPDDIPAAVLRALRLPPPQSVQNAPAVARYVLDTLRGRHLLLVLDNFEHLLDGAPFVSELLTTAPGLRALVTSRERLNLSGEAVLTVGPLQLPGDGAEGDLLDFSALRRFIENAWFARSDFAPEHDDLRHAARICHLVEGVPPGVILATLWANTLSLQEIADELEGGLGFLSAEVRDLPARHRSLRAVFDSSWRLLSKAEQDVLMRLAVFQDGFTRRAAQQVTGAPLAVLQGLLTKSLIQRDPASGRFQLHEMVRQFAADRLADSGDEETARQDHAQYYCRWLAAQEDALTGLDQVEGFNLIEADFANIRAAWTFAAAGRDAALIDAALDPLLLFAGLRMGLYAVRPLLDEALAFFAPAPGETPSRTWAQLQARACTFDDPATARRELAACRALAEAAGDEREIAQCAWLQGVLLGDAHDLSEAIAGLMEARARFRALGDRYRTAQATHQLVVTHQFMGHDEEARRFLRNFNAEARASGAPYCVAQAASMAGIYAQWADGDYAATEKHTRAARRIYLAARMRGELAMKTVILSRNALFMGDFARARELHFANENEVAALHDPQVTGFARTTGGLLAGLDGDYGAAHRLGQEAAALQPHHLGVLVMANLVLAIAEWGLGEFESAWERLRAGLYSVNHARLYAAQTWYLGIMALLLHAEHDPARAAEVLALALRHPASPTGWYAGWPALTRLRASLERDLGPAAFAAAWERGAALDLAALVRDLLAEA